MKQTTKPTTTPKDENAIGDLLDILSPLMPLQVAPSHPVRARADHLKEIIGDNAESHIERIRETVDMFYMLPMHEQRRILNGWMPSPKRPTAPEYARYTAETIRHMELPAEHVCKLSVSAKGKTLHYHDWEGRDSTDTIEVQLRRYTTKREALQAIEAIRAYVDEKWDEIIEGHPDDIGKLE